MDSGFDVEVVGVLGQTVQSVPFHEFDPVHPVGQADVGHEELQHAAGADEDVTAENRTRFENLQVDLRWVSSSLLPVFISL
jgi:hypothetical protein